MNKSFARRLIAILAAFQVIFHSVEALCPHSSATKLRPSSFASFVSTKRPNRVGQEACLSYNTASRAQTLALRATEISKTDEKHGENPEEPTARKFQIASIPVSKFRKLKDIMWIREAVEDLTATEFACSVESEQRVSNRKQKRAVDYEKLLSKLDRRVSDMICLPLDEIEVNTSDLELDENMGMGRFVYTGQQRNGLLK